jgi:hypothetical protein
VREKGLERERGLSERERIEMRGDESDGFTMDWSEREKIGRREKGSGGERGRGLEREREDWSEKKMDGSQCEMIGARGKDLERERKRERGPERERRGV